MAWSQGNHASDAAGQGLAMWDDLVCLNANWSCHDAAAAANCKVYKCEDAAENVLFYVRVDDNFVGYQEFQLWEGWDAVGHAGVGANITVSAGSAVFRHYRPIGAWGLAVGDHRVILCDMVNFLPTYIGAPRRYLTTYNIVLISSPGTGSSSARHGAGQSWASTTTNGSRFLFDESGNQTLMQGYGGLSTTRDVRCQGIDNIIREREMPVCGEGSFLSVGVLDGIISMGQTSLGVPMASGETVEIDGVDWVFHGSSHSTPCGCLVRKN